MSIEQEVSHACRRALRDDNYEALGIVIRQSGALPQLCEHEYPFVHRIKDVLIEGQSYRITRCVSCGGRYRVLPITAAAFSEDSGVPSWLEAEGLERWVAEESEFPSKGSVDWAQYRG